MQNKYTFTYTSLAGFSGTLVEVAEKILRISRDTRQQRTTCCMIMIWCQQKTCSCAVCIYEREKLKLHYALIFHFHCGEGQKAQAGCSMNPTTISKSTIR